MALSEVPVTGNCTSRELHMQGRSQQHVGQHEQEQEQEQEH